MRYVSNLIAPDLRPYFKLKDPPVQIMGHDIPSDPDFEPECGFFSDDEAAILYHVAKQVGGTWIDVGARFGWTAAHIMEAGCLTVLIDPQLAVAERFKRAHDSIEPWWIRRVIIPKTFTYAMTEAHISCRGVVIDGNHDDPEPLNDAMTAHGELQGEGVILMHDFWGAPIQRAVTWLMDTGYRCRIYNTPNGLALCWSITAASGLFYAPDHVPDPQFNWKTIRTQRCPNFDFSRCV